MADYTIKEVPNGTFEVWRVPPRGPLKAPYAFALTRAEAERLIRSWSARDTVNQSAKEFVAEMVQDFGDLLGEEYIRDLIRDHV